jgi:hypothetical protein
MFLLGSWELLIGAGSKRLIGVARCLSAGGLQLARLPLGSRSMPAQCGLSVYRVPALTSGEPLAMAP